MCVCVSEKQYHVRSEQACNGKNINTTCQSCVYHEHTTLYSFNTQYISM